MTTRRIVYRMAAMAAFLCGVTTPLLATPLPRYGAFLYSSLCRERESGDAAGFRVKLVRSPKGDSLYLDWSEGGLYGPMLATKLIIDPKTSKLSFTIPAHTPPSDISDSESYSGEISNEAIILEDAGAVDGHRHVVPRVKEFGTEMVPCKEL